MTAAAANRPGSGPGSAAGAASRSRVAKTLTLLGALLLAAGASAFMLFAPSYQTAWSDSEGNSGSGTATIVEVNGAWAIVLAILPIALALAPLLVPRRAQQPVTITAAALLLAWVVVGSWTIGMYYIPPMLCMLAAVFVPPRGRAPT